MLTKVEEHVERRPVHMGLDISGLADLSSRQSRQLGLETSNAAHLGPLTRLDQGQISVALRREGCDIPRRLHPSPKLNVITTLHRYRRWIAPSHVLFLLISLIGGFGIICYWPYGLWRLIFFTERL
jgi:hypothetical protein